MCRDIISISPGQGGVALEPLQPTAFTLQFNEDLVSMAAAGSGLPVRYNSTEYTCAILFAKSVRGESMGVSETLTISVRATPGHPSSEMSTIDVPTNATVAFFVVLAGCWFA